MSYLLITSLDICSDILDILVYLLSDYSFVCTFTVQQVAETDSINNVMCLPSPQTQTFAFPILVLHYSNVLV